jgi:hypothetical protein
MTTIPTHPGSRLRRAGGLLDQLLRFQQDLGALEQLADQIHRELVRMGQQLSPPGLAPADRPSDELVTRLDREIVFTQHRLATCATRLGCQLGAHPVSSTMPEAAARARAVLLVETVASEQFDCCSSAGTIDGNCLASSHGI